MPMTPQMRRGIDQIRDYLFGGGYPDPVANAEQLSFLFFFYLVEGMDRDNSDRAQATKRPYTSMFAGEWEVKNSRNAAAPDHNAIPAGNFRWSVWARGMNGDRLVMFLRDEVFSFYAEVAQRSAVRP